MHTLYIEQSIVAHPRTREILERFSNKSFIVYCKHYSEVFNPRSQNFRIQKQNPALILAQKRGQLILKTPEGFGIGGQQNYYFSHMLNCIYDCRYCFLQGMYNSANYVLFVNYEDFMTEIEAIAHANRNKMIYFFSGYDCDSLAFEPISGFLQAFLPFFAREENAILELRTKSTNIKELLKYSAFDNCVIAYSLTPAEISQEVEQGVSSVEKRIAAMRMLAEKGWKIGLRFDPLIRTVNFQSLYRQLIDTIFQALNPSMIHSVSVGPLRFPSRIYQRLIKLYPADPLLAQPLYKRENYFSYKQSLEFEMKQVVMGCLRRYLDETILFECNPL